MNVTTHDIALALRQPQATAQSHQRRQSESTRRSNPIRSRSLTSTIPVHRACFQPDHSEFIRRIQSGSVSWSPPLPTDVPTLQSPREHRSQQLRSRSPIQEMGATIHLEVSKPEGERATGKNDSYDKLLDRTT
jgi:hypothetical protein